MDNETMDPDIFSYLVVSTIANLNKTGNWSHYKAVGIAEDYGYHRFRWYTRDNVLPTRDIHTMIWIHPENQRPTRHELIQMYSTKGINLYSMNPSGIWCDNQEVYRKHTANIDNISDENISDEALMEKLNLVFYPMHKIRNTYTNIRDNFVAQKPIEKNVNYL
jgi:hypothetical protein